jgi:hypothetical protein
MSAAAETAAAIPAAARHADFPTWLPAMLVKELRQGLRTRGFTGALVGFQVVMTLFTIFAIAGGTGSDSLGMLQGAFWIVLTAQLLIVTPGRALMGLQAELDTRAIDLLLLTRLTAWRVVLGKWVSLLAQAALLVIAMLPYGVARYFFGSVDLAGEMKLITMIFAVSAVLTAAALWASALPKLARGALGFALIFAWQFIPGIGAAVNLVTGSRSFRGPGAAAPGGADLALLVFDAAVVLAICLVGAVRKLAPRAENQAPLMRLLPLLPFLAVPFLPWRVATGQLVFGGVLVGLAAALELARAEEPMGCHWRAWARFGVAGRLVGRLVQPGWASALEWVLVLAGAAAIGGAAAGDAARAAHGALLAAEALVFPALLLTYMSRQFSQRAAGYVLVLGGASLIAAVGTASAAISRKHELADLTLLLLPISSFWTALTGQAVPAGPVLAGQVLVAALVLGGAWRRARPYRRQRRDFEAAGTGGDDGRAGA